MSPLVLLPAVDVAGGRSVRLVGADTATETAEGDPLAALRWQREGCRWIHLVEFDAAFGRGSAVAGAAA